MSEDNIEKKGHGPPVAMKRPGTYIDIEDCKRLEDSCNDIREKLLIAFMWRCGLRISEVISLKKRDIHFDTGRIHVLHGGKDDKPKMGNMGVVSIPPLFLEYLKNVLHSLNDDDFIFPSRYRKQGYITRQRAWQIFRNVLKRSGLVYDKDGQPIHPHTLRHSFGVWLAKNGAKLDLIREQLRHKSLSTTTIYLRVASDEYEKEFKEIANKVGI